MEPIQGKHFSITDPEGVKTVIYQINKTEKEFLTNLRRLDDVTCIIVSHKKAALEICNRRIQIINGKIVEG